MALTRLVIFVPDTLVLEYDSLADSVAGSRSGLMRWALEHALPSVRDHVLSVAASGLAPHGVVAGPSAVPVARPRRRGRPPSSENARRLVHLQAQARAILEEAPDMDEEALRRLLVAGHAAALGISAASSLFDQAIRVVIDNPDNRAPEPVGEARPPRAGDAGS